MSAWVVSRNHIWALVETLRWDCWGGVNQEDLDKFGQLLWDENIRSVVYRYPDCNLDALPGPIDCDYKYGKHGFGFDKRKYTPVEILKACDCYEYQSCEHPGWRESEAHQIIERIRDSATSKLDGYEDAPWVID